MAEQAAAVRTTEAEFDAAWRAHRPYLVNLAFGMLRDIGAAVVAAPANSIESVSTARSRRWRAELI